MSLVRRLGVATAFAVLAALPAQAGPIQPYTSEAFATARMQGRPVLVETHAGWCPICRAQAPTLEAISKDPAFAKLIILRIDYDKQSAEKRGLNIQKQSTLVAFNGERETGRTVGVTDPEQIKALARSALR